MIRRVIHWFRSAITGRFVSRKYAEEHPAETVQETKKYDAERHADYHAGAGW